MKKIIVNSGNSNYPVIIDNSFFNKLPGILESFGVHNNLYIVIDQNVFKHYKELIVNTFSNSGNKIYYYILPSGESTKSEIHLKKIYKSLLENNFGRDTTLIAIGGGVTGDIAGYTAATYMRGIHLIHIPTTLLAMIDSSIGGKTGINFEKRKNIIGAFYQPRLVFIDTKFLTTLPQREINSAIGELIKYGLISNENFYDFLFKNTDKIKSLDIKAVSRSIIESVSIKAAIVSQDEFETKGIRKILNLGHTFAHAIESSMGFKIKHGEAVIIGIICALFLSRSYGLLKEEELKKLLHFPCSIAIPRSAKNFDNKAVIKAMINDKKNINDKIMFVLLTGPGQIIVDVPVEESTINYVLNRAKNNCLI
jgi:3-dehydroquinate synthase